MRPIRALRTFRAEALAAVLVLTALAVATAGCAAKRDVSVPTLKAAKASYDRGEFDTAAKQYKAIVKETPKNTEARRGLALTLAAKGDNAGAIAQYDKVIAQEPRDDASLYRMALLERLLGDADGALEHLGKAASLKATPTYLDEYARTLMQAGRYADAATAWGKALEAKDLTDENRVELLRVQAEAYASATDYDSAKEALRAAQKLDPENSDIEKRLRSFK